MSERISLSTYGNQVAALSTMENSAFRSLHLEKRRNDRVTMNSCERRGRTLSPHALENGDFSLPLLASRLLSLLKFLSFVPFFILLLVDLLLCRVESLTVRLVCWLKAAFELAPLPQPCFSLLFLEATYATSDVSLINLVLTS